MESLTYHTNCISSYGITSLNIQLAPETMEAHKLPNKKYHEVWQHII